jgi:hypothetical protein
MNAAFLGNDNHQVFNSIYGSVIHRRKTTIHRKPKIPDSC